MSDEGRRGKKIQAQGASRRGFPDLNDARKERVTETPCTALFYLNKSLIVFKDPADVKGSSVLTHSHIVGNDDQWIYLPALKRVKERKPALL